MLCGEEASLLHEGRGIIQENGINKNIPLMMCDDCLGEDTDPLSPQEQETSKIDFIVWKINTAVEYMKKEKLPLDKLKDEMNKTPAKILYGGS